MLVVGLLGIRIFEIGFEVEKGQCVTKALASPVLVLVSCRALPGCYGVVAAKRGRGVSQAKPIVAP